MPCPSASQEVELMEQEVRVLIRRLLDSRRVTAGNNLVPSSKAQVHNLLANKYLLVDEQEYNALKYNGSRSITFSEGLTSQNDSEFRDFTAAADRLHVKAKGDKRRRPSTRRLQRLKIIESAQARRPTAILEFINGPVLRTREVTCHIDTTFQNKDGKTVGSIVGRSYRCDACNESFNSKDLYDRHVVDRHYVVPTDVAPSVRWFDSETTLEEAGDGSLSHPAAFGTINS